MRTQSIPAQHEGEGGLGGRQIGRGGKGNFGGKAKEGREQGWEGGSEEKGREVEETLKEIEKKTGLDDGGGEEVAQN